MAKSELGNLVDSLLDFIEHSLIEEGPSLKQNQLRPETEGFVDNLHWSLKLAAVCMSCRDFVFIEEFPQNIYWGDSLDHPIVLAE